MRRGPVIQLVEVVQAIGPNRGGGILELAELEGRVDHVFVALAGPVVGLNHAVVIFRGEVEGVDQIGGQHHRVPIGAGGAH